MGQSLASIRPINPILTGLVLDTTTQDNTFLAKDLFETITVPERSMTILVENSRNFTGAGAGVSAKRSAGAQRQDISGFDRTSLVVSTDIYGLQDSIPFEYIQYSQFPLSEETRAVKKVSRSLMIDKEKRASSLLFDSSVFTNNSPTTKFNSAGAEPLSFLDQQKDTFFAQTAGLKPDTLVLGRDVFRTLARNPEVRGYLGSTTAGLASGEQLLNDETVKQVLRQVLSIPNVYVCEAMHDQANAGQTSSPSLIWNGETIGMYTLKGGNPAVGAGSVRVSPLACANFQYKTLESGSYDTEGRINRVVWLEEQHNFKVLDSTLGLMFDNCLA